MATSSSLAQRLRSLDGKSYGALKSLTGTYEFEGFSLHIDRVQSDPYAPPSRIRISVPISKTNLSEDTLSTYEQKVAVRDFIARDIADAIAHGPRDFRFVSPGQEILERSSVVIDDSEVQIRLTFGFPAAGRRVKGALAARLLVDDLPDLVRFSVLGKNLDRESLAEHVITYTDFLWLQNSLTHDGLIGFVANGSVLARASGDSDRPLAQAVPFESPESLQVELTTPSGRVLKGMGIRKGITLIVGGGYHGKSTVLKALERGVYAHVPGDGREFVITAADAMAVRAEDGRAVTGVNIGPFISNLPGGIDTSDFSTSNASGSTSQAANVAEALEIGTSALLMDEDTSATNFMIRDTAMKELVAPRFEPITPFVDRVRAMYDELGVSTVIVMGGSGAFFSEADTVIALNEYVPQDVTARAHEIAASYAPSRPVSDIHSEGEKIYTGFLSASEQKMLKQDPAPYRVARPGALGTQQARKAPRARGLHEVEIDKQSTELRYVSQLVDSSQTQAIALALKQVDQQLTPTTSIASTAQLVIAQLRANGLDDLTGGGKNFRGDLAMPRASELMATINRMRNLRVQTPTG